MTIINNHYTVYLHIFPDGKKYVGCTCKPIRQRWDGGLGYMNQWKMFDAILKVGWENIKHYVLFENLDKETALLTEAALIRAWHTYRPSTGYNAVKPKPDGFDDFAVPKFKRKKIEDNYDSPVTDRYIKRRDACETAETKRKNHRPVRLIETGEEFESITRAAKEFCVRPSALQPVIGYPNRTCGSVWIEDPDDGWRMEVRAHWKYVNNNETKDD